MDAELLAIGKYVPAVRSSLAYPEDFYSDTPLGATIITTVCMCVTTDGSQKLAQALGIFPWQYEQHCGLSGEGADLSLLEEAAEGGADAVACFLNLRAHGFKFYYLPNG